MDEIYENTEEVLGCHRKYRSEHRTSEDIYMNQEAIQTVQLKTTGPAPPGKKHIYKYYNYMLLKFCRQTKLKLKLRILYKLSEENKRLISGNAICCRVTVVVDFLLAVNFD